MGVNHYDQNEGVGLNMTSRVINLVSSDSNSSSELIIMGRVEPPPIILLDSIPQWTQDGFDTGAQILAACQISCQPSHASAAFRIGKKSSKMRQIRRVSARRPAG